MPTSPPGDLEARVTELERTVAELIKALEAANAALDELEQAVDAKESAAANASNALTQRVSGLLTRVKETTPGTGAGPAVSDTTPETDTPTQRDPAPWSTPHPGSIL